MLFFKNENGEVFAYETQGEREAFGADDLVAMTNEEILVHLNPTPTVEQIASVERDWRNGELDRADIKLNKVQDGMGAGTVTAWREYRCALRNWPEHESFPDSSFRPTAPDAPKEPTAVEPTVG